MVTQLSYSLESVLCINSPLFKDTRRKDGCGQTVLIFLSQLAWFRVTSFSPPVAVYTPPFCWELEIPSQGTREGSLWGVLWHQLICSGVWLPFLSLSLSLYLSFYLSLSIYLSLPLSLSPSTSLSLHYGEHHHAVPKEP